EHERPDVIEVGSPGLVPWVVSRPAASLGVPLVHFFHSNYPALLGRGWAGRSALRYARALDRRFAATVVASEGVAAELRRAGIDRVVRIPLGVDLRCFHPDARQGGIGLRQRLGVGGAPLVVYAGRFAAEKRVDLLLAAWPRLHERTRAHLVLV